MKFPRDAQYIKIAIYAFGVIAASVLFAVLVINFPAIWSGFARMMRVIRPLMLAITIAYVLNPLLKQLDNRLLPFISRGRLGRKPRRVLAIVLTYLVALAVLTLFVISVLPQLIGSIASLISNIPEYISVVEGFVSDVIGQIYTGAESSTFIGTMLSSVLNGVEDMLEQLYAKLIGLIPGVFNAGAQFTMGMINALFGLTVSIYFLYNKERLLAQCNKLFRSLLPQRPVDLMRDVLLDCNRVFSGFITGRIIDSGIIGVLCFLGMSIFTMPYPLLISAIVGVTNIIPIVGPFIGAIPSAFIIFIESPRACIGFIIFILALQQFDGNILGPKVMGNTIGLSALWIIAGILLFGGLYGIAGVLFGVPLIAVLYNLTKRYVIHRLRGKGLPVETKDYASEDNPLLK